MLMFNNSYGVSSCVWEQMDTGRHIQIRSSLFKILLVHDEHSRKQHSVNTSSLLGRTRKTSKFNLADCQDTVVLPKMFGRRIEITLLFK